MSETVVAVPFVDLGAQQSALAEELGAVFDDALLRTDWILGNDVDAFEREFAAYSDVGFGVGTDSGLSAIELILRAAGIGPGDEVITAANTFVATLFAISHTGATPVLVDIDRATYNVDPNQVEAAVTARTRAIIPVHLYGQPADMDALRDIAEREDLLLVEDACQAHGARYKGRRAGSLAHAAAFSFYPSKNLGAFGDGGMAVTDDPALRDNLLSLRNYGQAEKYVHERKAFNRRLDTLQAAILRVKLAHLDFWNERRREHAAAYERLLTSAEVELPSVPRGVEPVWHLYVIRVRGRDRIRSALAKQHIQTGIHYPIPTHLQPAYGDLGYRRGSFPVTEAAADEILSLPMYPELEPAQVERVCEKLIELIDEQV
jgi:dTDP-4-amino-4,6-dideoxygalactose transaminase